MKISRAILVSLLALAGFSADAGHRALLAAPPDRSEDPGGYAIGLRSPDLAQRMAHVGTYFRAESPLPRASSGGSDND